MVNKFFVFCLFLTPEVMITGYIIELLYEHNCVVLPGFGGFIANRLPSKLNEAQQRVEPPRKIVAFNGNLTQNDGLLAHYISEKESCTYDEANIRILDFVIKLFDAIQLDKHGTLRGIGDFYLNSENKIVFVPESDINFSKESYGLFPISIRRIQREKNIPEIPRPVLREQPLKTSRTNRRKKITWINPALFIILPLTIGFISQQTGILQKADFDLNNIFKNKKPEIKIELPSASPSALPSKTNTTPVPVIHDTAANEVIIAEPKSEPVIISDQNSGIKPEEKAQATIIDKVKHFHVIGGSFAVEANSGNFLRILREKGYQAYIAGISPGGLTMVSYNGFSKEEEALQFLLKIQQTENRQAWIFKN